MTSLPPARPSAASPRRRPGIGATAPGIPGMRRMVRGVLARLFGPAPFDPSADPGDPGLTGPGSSSWVVIAEPAAIAGGIRGLLVQVAHPLAMAGVHDHSAFRTDPLGRLQRTSAYVTTTTFGSTREALRVSAIVRGVHPRVVGRAPDGQPYRADDPRLLTWVSIALTSSFLAAHRVWSPVRLTAAAEDAFVAEQSRIAALLDPRVDVTGLLRDPGAQRELRDGRVPLPMIDDGTLPVTVATLEDVLEGYRAELGINHQGREALDFLRRPPIPSVARGAYRAVLAGAFGSLSPDLRDALEIDWSVARRRACVARASLVITALRTTTGTSPARRAAHARTSALDQREDGRAAVE